eukprot:8358450-Alexandrium_andersonii.AAC.1
MIEDAGMVVEPMSLADDLVIASGMNASEQECEVCDNHELALDLPVQYTRDLGASLSEGKSHA